ncbi:WD40 repeat domain-containing protein [Streptomyces xanthii]|uniref:Ig-like domain repeat protein n=1 Tax=Streptomyces xanthii TaxID=2768069 RepID=A0A7H1B9H9_9ACTN|nr:Ig-like domain repeat protein [Streptomyces xanthii]QNS05384.1 Ig-like domain repeat protein [Streptomyces xanthii]
MRRRALSTATAVAVLAGSAALGVAGSGTAVADPAKALGVKSVGDMAVDGVHKRIYLSDPQSDAIVVTDYAGAQLRRITGLDGVRGLALSADSSRLYAAVTDTDTIAEIDTAAGTTVGSYALGGADAPLDLAVAGDVLWFSYGPSGDGALGSLDTTQPTPEPALGQKGSYTFYGAPVIAVSPDGKELAAGDPNTSGGVAAVYDLSGTTATERVVKGLEGASFHRQLAFSPDGTELFVAGGSGSAPSAYATTDLSPVRTYPAGGFGSAVAVSPSGNVAEGSSPSYDSTVHVYRPGGTTAIRSYALGHTSTISSGDDTLVPGAVAWTPDGSLLFAVSDNYEGAFRLHTYTDPNRTAPTLTVNAPSTATRATSLTATGKISSVVPFTAPVQLTVTRSDLETPSGKVVKTVTTKADGTYSFTDTPPAGGKVTYKVSYAGDADHAPVSKSDAVEVSRNSTTLTLNKNKNVYEYGSDVTFTAHLGTTYKNRKVDIYANPYGSDRPNKLVKSGTVNSSGNLSVTLDLTRDVTLSAVYAGDARYKPKTVTNTVYTRARSSVTPSNHYKTGTIGSHKYYWFHKSSTIYVTTSMNYYTGRQFRLDLQVYAGGAWRSGGSEYFNLGTAGTTKVNMGAVGASGYKFRVRAVYVNGSSGDNVNTTKYSSWKYLYSTN